MPCREVTITCLQLTHRGQLRVAPTPTDRPALVATRSTPEVSRRLYRAVGDRWYWHDRRGWTDEQWHSWIETRDVRTWVVHDEAVDLGYFQLARGGDDESEASLDDVEIAYLGLTDAAIGRGWGGWLLTEAVGAAWDLGAARVWLHTCTLDHPAALSNYRARGFEIFATRTEMRDLSEPGSVAD